MRNSNKVSQELNPIFEAKQHMPMGVSDNYRYWGDENTLFIRDMFGAELTDQYGRTYVDFRLAYGPIILGYRDSRVDNAVIRCIRERGAMCGLSTELEVSVIRKMKAMCPNLEKVRFANSGTEAVIGATRTARGYTKRDRIVVVEGSFHGLHDEMMWKSDVEHWSFGDKIPPKVVAFGAGVSPTTRQAVDLISLNDVDAVRQIFSNKGSEIAAVILEPIMGNCGSISASKEYVKLLRESCDEHGALLIFDEVKTGFRVAKGGAQELYGVFADLTTYAKSMGNGYAVAAFGGRADVMDCISILSNGVVHGGTYTANLVALSAAEKTLDILNNTNALSTVDATGRAIQNVLSSVFSKQSIEHVFAGPSSMFGVHLTDEVPQNYRDWRKTNSDLYYRFALELFKQGLLVEQDSREPWFICEAHRAVDLDWLNDVATKSLEIALTKR